MNRGTESTEQRKSRHIDICLEEDVASATATGFAAIRLRHEALPNFALADVDTTIEALGLRWAAPLVISSMTGGTERAGTINRHLAVAAEAAGIPLALGSGRAALENAALLYTYDVRPSAPNVMLFANIGAVQFNYGVTVGTVKTMVETIGARALYLHFNPLQEALQSGGDTDFRNLEPRIAELAASLAVPVVAKSVGSGISVATARRLFACGVAAIDVAGAGGTSWARVEGRRSENARYERIAEHFASWGYPTAEATVALRAAFPDRTIIASGGVRSGVDIAKAIALGATACGMAMPFLEPATRSADAVSEAIDDTIATLRIAMFASGARTVPDLLDARYPPRGTGEIETRDPSTRTSNTSTSA